MVICSTLPGAPDLKELSYSDGHRSSLWRSHEERKFRCFWVTGTCSEAFSRGSWGCICYKSYKIKKKVCLSGGSFDQRKPQNDLRTTLPPTIVSVALADDRGQDVAGLSMAHRDKFLCWLGNLVCRWERATFRVEQKELLFCLVLNRSLNVRMLCLWYFCWKSIEE